MGLAAKIGSLECTKTLILYGARLIISQTDLENWKIAAKAWLSQWQLNSIVITNELNQIKQPLEWAIQSNNVELVSFLIQCIFFILFLFLFYFILFILFFFLFIFLTFIYLF